MSSLDWTKMGGLFKSIVEPDSDDPTFFRARIHQPMQEHGVVAAMRIWKDLLPENADNSILGLYYTDKHPTSKMDTAGLGQINQPREEIKESLKGLAKFHREIIANSKYPGRVLLERFKRTTFNLNSISAPIVVDLTTGQNYEAIMDKYFSSIGLSYGINPTIVKSAFVTTLKNYGIENPRILTSNQDGVVSAELWSNLEKLWKVPTINLPVNYPMYRSPGIYPGVDMVGLNRGRIRKRRRTRR